MSPTRHALVLVVVLSIAALATPASAHADKEVFSGTIAVPHGGSREIPIEVHYHRLVGHVRVDDPVGAELKVRLTNPDGSNPADLAPPGDDMTLNALLPCCKGETWSPFVLVFRNDGTQDVQADVRLVLVHDGLAVLVEDAETGAAATGIGAFGIVAVGAAFLLRRPYAGAGRPGAWARTALGAHLIMWLIVVVLTIYGLFRFGGGLAGSTVAATADLPWTDHPIMNTHAVILAALFVLWAVSVFAWVMAARRAGQEAKRVAALGLGMGVATLVVFGLWMAEYGALVVPTLLAVASAGIPLVGAWVVVRNRPRGDDVDRASVDGAMAQEPIPAEAERAGD